MTEYKVSRNRGMFEIRLGTFVYEVFRKEEVAKAIATSLNDNIRNRRPTFTFVR
jgi:hypothetical protein